MGSSVWHLSWILRFGVEPAFLGAGSTIDRLSRNRARVQREQVIIVVTVGVRAEVGLLTGLTNHSDFGAFASCRIDRVIALDASLDVRDGLLFGDHPMSAGVAADVGDVFVSTVEVGLHYASNLKRIHCLNVSNVLTRSRRG